MIRREYEEELFNRLSVFAVGRTIYFFDEVSSSTVGEAFKLMNLLENINSKTPINFFINSTGGDVYSGLALFDRLKSSPCKITTIGTGFVASMGFMIFLAGDRRLITPTTMLLNHQNWMNLSGRTEDFKIEAEELTRLEKLCIDLVCEATGLTPAKIKQDIKRGDKYITPEEAITMNYAHSVVNYRKK